jgi:hypothetical protein
MRQFLLQTLIDRARESIDAENQGAITTTTWQAFLSQMYGKLHAIVAGSGYRYFETAQTVITDGLTPFYALPADHLSSTTVVRVVTPTDRRRLRRVSAQQMARMVHTGPPFSSEASVWGLVGQTLFLGGGMPPAAQTYEHRYIPQAADLTAANPAATQVDVVTAEGEAFLIYGAAVKGLLKMDKDVRFHRDERDAAEVTLREWANLRALHEGHLLQTADDPYGENLYDPAEYTDRRGN